MPSRFHWHPDARAFAGRDEVMPTIGVTHFHIDAHPSASALEGMSRIFGRAAFCVSDTAPPDLSTLPADHFATLTGGTSGAPKLILRSQKSWIDSFHANASLFTYGSDDSIAVLGGLSHSLALYGILEGLHLGFDVHALDPLKPTAQSAELHSKGCTILYATPTQLRLLPVGHALPSIRLILCGGGMLNAATRHHIATIFPNAALHVFYGAAETSFITLSDAQTPEGSVGRAYPQVELAIRDPDSGGTGTIWVRSPYLFARYLQGSSAHTRRDGDWLTLAEIGRLDAQGYLFLRGRAGRVFTIADKTVYPEEIEAQLMSCKDIPQCNVLARPDPLRGNQLVLAVDGAEDASRRADLLAFCKAHDITPPREIIFLDPFPYLPSGKPDLTRIAALTGCVL